MTQEVFTGSALHSGVTTAKNLLVLTAPAGVALQILGAKISNASNETNEQMDGAIYAVGTAGVGTPTSVTAVNTCIGSSATASATLVHTYGTTEPVLAAAPVWYDAGASLSGLEYVPRMTESIKVMPGSAIVLCTVTTITSANLLAQITWRETTSGTPPLE
jgi:hypothetical protein